MNAPASKSSSSSWLFALVALASIGASSLLVFKALLPAQQQVGTQEKRIAELELELKVAEEKAKGEHSQLAQLLKTKDSLSQKHTETQEALAQAIAEKESAIAEVEAAKTELTDTLGVQIAAGDVLIEERRGQLVVDVADKLLFESGQTEVSEGGQEFLLQVADSLRRLPRKLTFQVGGHTDSQRVVSKELLERFPTNWELSTTRASNVVRFLQETGRVPGRQLVAAGYAQFRPTSSNNTKRGRAKNRRIEIILVTAKR